MMSDLHHLLRRSAGAMALVMALAVLLGSLCPRGWFLCVHEGAVTLADAAHAAGDDACAEDDCCPHEGCLDLAISLVLDDQAAIAAVTLALPSAMLVGFLPDARHAGDVLVATRGVLGDPPLPDLLRHVRLLV